MCTFRTLKRNAKRGFVDRCDYLKNSHGGIMPSLLVPLFTSTTLRDGYFRLDFDRSFGLLGRIVLVVFFI